MTSGTGDTRATADAADAPDNLADLLRTVAAALTAGDPPPHLRALAQRLQTELDRRSAPAPAPRDPETTLR